MKAEILYERERDSLLDVIQQHRGWLEQTKEYNAKIIKSGNQIELQVYELWPTKAGNKIKSEKISRPAQQKLNEKYRQQRCARIINANFDQSGSWVTLTYKQGNRPENLEAAEKMVYNWLRAVQRKYSQTDVKAVYTTSFDAKHCHHHICINVSDRDGLEDLWSSASERARKRKNPYYSVKKYGRTQARRLQEDDWGFTGMALYICKHGKYRTFGKLEKPVEKKSTVLKGKKLSKKFVNKIVRDKDGARREILKMFPNCQFNDIDIRQTPYTSGYYIYRRLKQQEDDNGRMWQLLGE